MTETESSIQGADRLINRAERVVDEATDFLRPDYYLQELVRLANKVPLGLGICLNIGGLVISGELVSGKSYFEQMTKELAGGYRDPAAGEAIKQFVGQFGSIYEGIEEQEQSKIHPPTYIHLRNAKLFHPAGSPMPGNRGVWWRGRLSSVDGFFIGYLGDDPSRKVI